MFFLVIIFVPNKEIFKQILIFIEPTSYKITYCNTNKGRTVQYLGYNLYTPNGGFQSLHPTSSCKALERIFR